MGVYLSLVHITIIFETWTTTLLDLIPYSFVEPNTTLFVGSGIMLLVGPDTMLFVRHDTMMFFGHDKVLFVGPDTASWT